MAGAWWLADGLVTLRSQVNAAYPKRDKASDGSIGDAAHAARSTSDHNPDPSSSPPNVVRAIDLDEDLLGAGNPDGAKRMRDLVETLRQDAKAGREKRLSYLIYEGRIASAKSAWEWRSYNGSNPHDKHAHISATTKGDHDGRPWNLGGDDMPITDADAAKIAKAVRAEVSPSFQFVLKVIRDLFAATGTKVDRVGAKVDGIDVSIDVDASTLASEIVDGLGPDVAKAVAAELSRRLAA